MSRQFAVALVILLSLDAVAAGQPKAVIVAPEKCRAGDLVMLQSTGSVGRGFRWIVYPQEAQERLVEMPAIDDVEGQLRQTGSVAFFANSRPRAYLFILAVCEGDQVDVAMHVLDNRADAATARPKSSEWKYRNTQPAATRKATSPPVYSYPPPIYNELNPPFQGGTCGPGGCW